MLDVTSSLVWVHAPSATATPTSVPAMRKARLRSTGILIVISLVLVPSSVRDETVGAAIVLGRLDPAGNAIDAVDAAQQVGLRIRRGGKSVIRPRQVLLRHGANDIGRHQHHQLGLVVGEIAASK